MMMILYNICITLISIVRRMRRTSGIDIWEVKGLTKNNKPKIQ